MGKEQRGVLFGLGRGNAVQRLHAFTHVEKTRTAPGLARELVHHAIGQIIGEQAETRFVITDGSYHLIERGADIGQFIVIRYIDLNIAFAARDARDGLDDLQRQWPAASSGDQRQAKPSTLRMLSAAAPSIRFLVNTQ